MDMENKTAFDDAAVIYDKFSLLGGAKHIATMVNIQTIIDICRKENPGRILEMGGGIGTLSFAMLRYSNAFIDIYENNDFCRQKLKENLVEYENRYTIIDTYRMLPPVRQYDIMVIDGGNKEDYHPEWLYASYLLDIKTIFIEGFRRSQYAWISKALSGHYICKAKRLPGHEINEKFHKGGTLISCTPNNSSLLCFISYIHGRLITEDYLFNRTYKFLKRKLWG